MSGYTKGPWLQRAEKYDDWGIIRSQETGWIVAKAEAGTHITQDELNVHRTNRTDPYEANARLIAAAPELLEALMELASEEFRDDGDPILDRARMKARAAIAKAVIL